MKKIFSILMILLIILSVCAVPASAEKAAQTIVSFDKGDEVVYALKLTTPEKVVGCDFSIYYDSSVLKVKEVADFTGTTDEHQAMINPDLKDEVIGNWSILSGVKFDNRAFCTITFEARTKGESHLSYYIRYLYPESMEQFKDYTLKCDVTVNKSKVVDNKAPELNTEIVQEHGKFINSVTGDGKDADVNMADNKKPQNNADNNGGAQNENNANGNSANINSNANADNNANNSSSKADKKDKSDKKDKDNKVNAKDDKATEAKNDEKVDATDAVDATVANPASPLEAATDGGVLTSIWFWVVVAIIVAGGGVGGYIYFKKKK